MAKHPILANDISDIAARRKFNSILQAKCRTGRAADHAHFGRGNYRLVLFIVKFIYISATRCYAKAAANTAIFNNHWIPLNVGP